MDTTLPARDRSTQTSESQTLEPSVEPGASCCDGEVAVAPSLDAAQATTLANRLKALADPTRLRLLDLLVQQAQPLCVCDLTAQFDLHQPTISHHLRILREARFIQGERRGVWSYYTATDAGKRCLSVAHDLL